ncbi:hypothetical protein BH09BAC5_BH09BAC5_09970 [soil metagenome]
MAGGRKRNVSNEIVSDLSKDEIRKVEVVPNNSERIELGGEFYTKEQLEELDEYLRMIANLVIEIFYDELH